MEKIASEIGEKLISKEWCLAIAESCTGGLVCKMVTDVAGSSQWFDRGFITYTNQAKIDMVNVSESILIEHGAVSLPTVEAMTRGVLENSQAEVSLAISGVAGPAGGSPSKPVGTVCFAWADKFGKSFSEVKLLSGDREQIRLKAAIHALTVLKQQFL